MINYDEAQPGNIKGAEPDYKQCIIQLLEYISDTDDVFLIRIITLLRLHIEKTGKH